MSTKARLMDDKVRMIANKNTTKDGIRTKPVRRQGVKRNQGMRWVVRNSQTWSNERGGF
jgi:hypothetical protein